MVAYCQQSTSISIALWDYISQVYAFKLKVAEIGITNHLVFDIISFYSHNLQNCEVYVQHAKNENLSGADIDLFIQQKKGNYLFFKLQAKVMNNDGKYAGIAKWGPTAQYNKLIKSARKQKALPYYILYNGRSRNSIKGKARHGVSLVQAIRIKKYRLNQNRFGYKRNEHRLTFDLLHGLGMKPYSWLFCGDFKPMGNHYHSRDEIFTEYPYTNVYDDNKVDLSDRQGEENDFAATRIILSNEHK